MFVGVIISKKFEIQFDINNIFVLASYMKIPLTCIQNASFVTESQLTVEFEARRIF